MMSLKRNLKTIKMWLIAKYKSKEFKFFKNILLKDIDKDAILYFPKIQKQKFSKKNKLETKDKNILGNYIILHSPKFSNNLILKKLSSVPGLSYILNGFKESQGQIEYFIKHCKKHEDENGYLKQSFFDFDFLNNGKFIKGPFINYIFKVIEEQKNKLKILVNGKEVFIKKNNLLQVEPI